MTLKDQAIDAVGLSEEVYRVLAPLLGGKPPLVQGAVLVDLVARWLAGHIDTRGDAATLELRTATIEEFLNAAIALAQVYDLERQAELSTSVGSDRVH